MFFAGFLQALDDLGLREQTAIAFVADHGESWGERYDDKSEIRGTYHMHGADLYDEVVRVPLILSAPGLEPTVVPSQVSLVDLLPTMLELAEAPIDGLDGSSLLPLARGSEAGDRPALIVGTDKGAVSQLALRQPPWKLTVHVQSGEEEAYRLDVDSGEVTSRSDDVPGELRERLYAELETVSRQALTAEEEALVEQRLSDLGYL
jgi:arylsulfatase A-like enzyme